MLCLKKSFRFSGVFVNDYPKYEGHTLDDVFIATVLSQLSNTVIMLLPVLACDALWSLDENVYAAMTLTNPVQGLVIGALCGLSRAAGVIVGKRLGNREFDEAYSAAKKLLYGFIGSLFLSLAVVLTSGGKTHYVMLVDTVGTWCFGVPLGLLAAFVLKLSIPYVYLMLSLEECVRFVISVFIFRKKKWMHQLNAA